MSESKNKHIKEEKETTKNIDEIEELKIFIKKKRIQNEALKKIMAKLNEDKNHKSNKK